MVILVFCPFPTLLHITHITEYSISRASATFFLSPDYPWDGLTKLGPTTQAKYRLLFVLKTGILPGEGPRRKEKWFKKAIAKETANCSLSFLGTRQSSKKETTALVEIILKLHIRYKHKYSSVHMINLITNRHPRSTNARASNEMREDPSRKRKKWLCFSQNTSEPMCYDSDNTEKKSTNE